MKKTRLIALLLTVIMVIGAAPVTSWAEDAPEEPAVAETAAAEEAVVDEPEALPAAEEAAVEEIDALPADEPEEPIFLAAEDTAVASGTCGANLTWTLTGETDDLTLTISGTGEMYDYTSDSPAPWYSYRSSITSLVIEEGLTRIGTKAFIYLGNLTSVWIPDGITVTGSDAFGFTYNLANIHVPEAGTWVRFPHAEIFCENVHLFVNDTEVTEIIIPEGTGDLFNDAFENFTSITSVVVPESLTSIPSYAFSNCKSLTEITLPGTLSYISTTAFEKCTGLQTIYYRGTEAEWAAGGFQTSIPEGVSVICSDTVPVVDSGTIGDNAFWVLTGEGNELTLTISGNGPMSSPSSENAYHSYSDRIVKIVVQEGITSIPYCAFYGYNYTQTIILPESVTEIDGQAFASCSRLTTVIIPGNVTNLGGYAFDSCSKLTDIIIPNGVTRIEDGTFGGCSELISVTVPDSVTYIGAGAFYNCSKLTNIIIPEGVTTIGPTAFLGCSSFTDITIPDSVTNIGENAFNGCSSLSSISIPNGVTRIKESVFNGCSSLTNVSIPEGVTDIGAYAFYECSSLSSIILPNGVTRIENDAFNGCSRLTEVSFPESLTSIEAYAFCGCRRLNNITIPDSVVSIGNYAFSDCVRLTSVVIPVGVSEISDFAFYQCYALEKVVIPQSVTRLGRHSFGFCRSLNDLSLPNGLISIESYAFYRCSSLTSIIIPESVTKIYDMAFFECDSLATIIISNKVESFGDNSFSGLPSPSDIYYRGTCEEWNAISDLKYAGIPDYTSIHFIGTQITNIELNHTELELLPSQQLQLEATILPADATDPVLHWSSSDEAVATVDQNGLVSAISCGTAVITAASTDLSDITATCTIQVSKGTYDMSGITFPDAQITYDGTAHDLVITGTLPDGVSVSFTGNSQTTVGAYTVTAHFSGDEQQYEPIPDMTATLTITPAENRWTTPLTCPDASYTEPPQPSAAAAFGTPAFTFSSGPDGEFTAEPPVLPGTYYVRARVPETANYSGLDMTVSFVIRPGQNYWTEALTCEDITYGETPAPHATAAAGEVIYTYSSSADGPFTMEAPAQAGTWYVQATAEAEHYYVLSTVRSFTIHKAVYDMSGVTFEDLTVPYDGTDQRVEISGELPEGVTVRYIGNDRTNVGSYYVIARFMGDRANYEPIPDMEAELVIERGVNSWISPLSIDNVIIGQAPAPTAEAAHGTPVFTYGTEEDGEFTPKAPSGVGFYYVRADVNGGSYEDLSDTAPFSILFSDVTDVDAFYFEPVYWAVDRNITTGYSDGTFRPWNNSNRAAVVTFLWRLQGQPEPAGEYPFSDPTGNADFDTAITWAVEQGITTGYSDNTFRPWNTCNRAAVVTFLWRLQGEPEPAGGYPFSDATGNASFDTAIAWAVEQGITTGYSADNTFRPWNTCNRASIVTFLWRMTNAEG